MLTNPSPNARIPRALSRRRRLRRSVPGLLIGGAASMDVSQKLHAECSNLAAEIGTKTRAQPPSRPPIDRSSGSESCQRAGHQNAFPQLWIDRNCGALSSIRSYRDRFIVAVGLDRPAI